MNISQAAKACGLSSKTIRYYEEQGIIPPADRSENGYRAYTSAHIEQLQFIKRARNLGFNLHDARELLRLAEDPQRTSAEVKITALAHIDRINQQIAELESIRDQLLPIVASCQGDDSTDCPIIDQLSGRS